MPHAVQPDAVCLQDGVSGEKLLRLPIGKAAAQRWHAPYIVCHRADLQQALLAEVRQRGNIAMQLESAVTHHNSDARGVLVRVQYNDRIEEHRGALLVGSDGVWSNTRNALSDLDRARYTGSIAWRVSVPADRLPASFSVLLPEGTNVVAWTGSNAHLIAYPIRSGELMNFVAVARDRKKPRALGHRSQSAGAEPEFYPGFLLVASGHPRSGAVGRAMDALAPVRNEAVQLSAG